ncbi:MAG: MATE family efflux transporter [Candidatus Cloacimonetes bacterium]|nr:MATE family efflux transporter [Candidatus Cloacimonadota bacterium]
MEKKHILADDNVNKLLLKLSVPAMTGMITMALYNVVDTIFVGRGIGFLAIAGLSIVFPIQIVVMAVGQLVGIGAGSCISRYLGAQQREKARTVLGNAYLMTISASLLITLTGLILAEPLLKLFGATEQILPYARDYYKIIIFATILFTTAMASNNILRSEGRARAAMLTMIIGAVLNILLDPLFIFVFHLGVKGAALATVLSQFIAVLYVIFIMRWGKGSIKIGISHFKPDFRVIGEITAIGMSSFLRNIAGSMIFILINNSLSMYGGDMAIAAYGIIQRMLRFLFMPIFGIAQGMQPIVGYNFGADLPDKIRRVIRTALISATAMATFGFIIIQLFAPLIIAVFTEDSRLIGISSRAVRSMILVIPLIGFQIVGTTIFQAMGKALPSLLLSMSREILFLIPAVIVLPRHLGLSGVWISFPIADIFSFLLTLILYLRLLNSLKHKFIKLDVDPIPS